MYRNDDLIVEVKNVFFECVGILVNEYEEGLEKIGKYLVRYLVVRQRRLLFVVKFWFEEYFMNDIDDDSILEISSNFSGMSVYIIGYVKCLFVWIL